MTESEPTVFVVDDDDSVRDALRCMLEADGFAVQTYGSAKTFLDSYDGSRRGCLLLDVQMPEMDGPELQRQLAKRHIFLPIIMVTAHASVPIAVDALRSGAVDFVEKPFDEDDLISRIRQALARDVRIDFDASETAEIKRRLETLSERERQVLQKLVAGKWLKLIASELGTSPNTVKNQRARIMEKMQAETVTELVRMAMLAQFVGPSAAKED